MSLGDVLFGRPLKTADQDQQRIGTLRGVPILGLDALSSAAYGPEALLTVLLPLGISGIHYVLPLTFAILGVLAAVAFSYWQTLAAYPNGGGSYTVARENIGRTGSLVAAAALGLDYLLTVAVGISAGVGAAASAIPALLPHTLPLCLGVLLVITVVNLRGVRASGGLFSLPTLAFVGSLGVIIVLGLARAATHGGVPSPVVAPPAAPAAVMAAATPWLLVRAFANGTTAMTGVEAVSNAVPLFRQPPVANARRALAFIMALLMALLVGIALLCRAYHVTATAPGQAGYESVLSQLAEAVLGRGPAYGFSMASVVVVLALSANTSFADFPRVARLLAADHFLPEPFERQGRRLVFSYGIAVLAGLSAVLLVAFGGVTDRLIPLFAVGALLAFTMSQSGMVVHWYRAGVRGPRLWVNALGATATGVTVVLVVVSKFVEGAWVSLLVILAFVALFGAMRRSHERTERAMRTDAPLDLGARPPTLAVVPIRRWDVAASKTLRWALSIGHHEILAVQVLADDRPQADLAARWHDLVEAPAERAGLAAPKLLVLRSDYRGLYGPLVAHVTKLANERTNRQMVVVVPELVAHRWVRAIFPFDFASVLRAAFLCSGGPPVVVVSVPTYVRD